MKTLQEIVESWIMPKITLEWVEFKDLEKTHQLHCLNFIAWTIWLHKLMTETERKRIYERTKKEMQKLD